MEEIISIVTNLVSNVGFPIACVAVMFWQMEKERAAHAEESKAWVEALNRNTEVMNHLLGKLDG